jgi:predicted solute-binding protein
MSTILVSRANKIRDGMKIAVTAHTKTTEFYLSSVLQNLKVEYDLVHTDKTSADDLLDIAEYALVIGDEAISVYGTDQNILMDIGYEFSRLYHLSPVYAVMVTRGAPEDYEVEMLDRAVSGAEKYRDAAAMENSAKFGLPESIFKRYYSLIRYDFNRNVERTINFLSASPISEKTIE